MTIRHGLSTTLAAGAAAMLLAACGGSSGDDPASGQPDDTKRLAFAKCMRAAGLDFEDPKSSGGKGSISAVRIPKGFSPRHLEKIQQDCQRKTGGGPKPPSPEEQAKFRDAALKFAKCMRAHGVNIPDPQVGGGGIKIQSRSAPSSSGSGPNPDSPAFQRAQTACQKLLPGGRGPMLSTMKGGGKGPGNAAVLGGGPDEKAAP